MNEVLHTKMSRLVHCSKGAKIVVILHKFGCSCNINMPIRNYINQMCVLHVLELKATILFHVKLLAPKLDLRILATHEANMSIL